MAILSLVLKFQRNPNEFMYDWYRVCWVSKWNLLLDLGNKVICVDKDKKNQKLNSGISPIYEPGLDELIKKNHISGRLTFSNDLKKAVNALI